MSSQKTSQPSAGTTMGPSPSDLEGPVRAPFLGPEVLQEDSSSASQRQSTSPCLEVKQIFPLLLLCGWTDHPKALLTALSSLKAHLPLDS